MGRVIPGLLAALVHTIPAAARPLQAQAPLNPRAAQAAQLAAQQRQEAEGRRQEALRVSTAAAAASAPAVARAQAWEAALRKLSETATPLDADLLVTAVRGAGSLLRAGQSGSLQAGAALREGDAVSTADGRAELRFHDGCSLALAPGTALRVLQAPRSFPQQSVFTLERGSLHWNASPGAQGLTKVLTPRSLALLRSGQADLRAEPGGAAALVVYSGSAELSARPEAAAAEPGWWEELFQ